MCLDCLICAIPGLDCLTCAIFPRQVQRTRAPPPLPGLISEDPCRSPLSSEYGTHKTVTTRFSSWLSGRGPHTLLSFILLARQPTVRSWGGRVFLSVRYPCTGLPRSQEIAHTPRHASRGAAHAPYVHAAKALSWTLEDDQGPSLNRPD